MAKIEKLLSYLKEMAEINYLISILQWEMDTIVPKKSIDFLISVKTKLEMEYFAKTTNPEYEELINDVINDVSFNNSSEEEKRYIKYLKEECQKAKRVSKDFYERYCSLISKSTSVWVEAKIKKDYLIIKPLLEEVIAMTKKYYRFMYPKEDLYNSMLNTYESGLSSDKIDKLFVDLKHEIIPIIKKLKPKKIKQYNQEYSDSELINMAKFLLNYIGFDNNRGTLGVFPHGYTATMNKDDIRIAFSNNNPIFDHICTIIHEGGHGIFEQNVSNDLRKYLTYDVNKYALHESQSRFYENILGRNENFWLPIFEDFKKMLKIEISIDELIEYLNDAKPSLIRTEADELTYCLHIIMRYEIERDLFSDKITVEDLPRIWQEKTKEYLGLDIENDANGVLQDVHWAQGNFGYFPSYLVGSIFDGMLIKAIEESLGSIDELLKNGEIQKITKFLNENIHQYGGTYNIVEVAKKVCKKDLTIEPLIEYFKNKYN